MSELSPIVSVDWLREHLGEPGVVVVDTRPFPEYRAGHIPGALVSDQNAIRIPVSSDVAIVRFQEAGSAELERLGIRTGDRVIFYEAISGCYAARGVWMLDYLGISGAAILDGGMTAWLEAGGEVDRTIPDVDPTEISISADEEILTTAGQILDSFAGFADPAIILDTRSELEYLSGTIPSSVHLEWTKTLDASGRFRPLPELRELYAGFGVTIDREEPIVTFCGSGYRAAHSYLVLKALGFDKVKNYVPSWSEWGNRSELPVERPGRS